MPDKKAALRRCNHEGSLRQRKDGRWEVRLTVPSWKGPPRRCSYYFSRKADAVAMLRGQISAYDNLGPGGSPRLKVSQWLWTWLMEIKKPDIRPSTYNLYESILNKHLAGLGNIRLYKLETCVIQDFYNSLLKSGKSPQQVRRIHKILHQALRCAVKKSVLLTDPSQGIDLPRVPTPERHHFTVDQQMILWSISSCFPHGICIRLALATGMRIGEITALRWKDVDLSSRTLWVRHTKHDAADYPDDPSPPKTPNSYRTIPLIRPLAEELKEWRTAQSPDSETCPVFPNKTGSCLSNQQLRAEYQEMLHQTGLPLLTFHSLRHTFATRALENGMDIKTLSALLGHSSVAFTMDIYVHCSDQHKQKEMQRMNYEIPNDAPECAESKYQTRLRDLSVCPSVMTLEQFRKACHISKRKARKLLMSGEIPCEITDRKTWKYRIRKEDALNYLMAGPLESKPTNSMG